MNHSKSPRPADALPPAVSPPAAGRQAIAARLAARLPDYGYTPDAAACERLATYLDLLLRWNRRVRLVGSTSLDVLIDRHLGESLVFAPFLDQQWQPNASRLVDVGSGAGFPGLALALALPQINTTLVESNLRKAAFLRAVVRETGSVVEVIADRLERLPAQLGSPIIYTSRAIEDMPTLPLRLAAIARPGDRLALWASAAQAADWQSQSGPWLWTPPLAIPFSRNRVIALASRP